MTTDILGLFVLFGMAGWMLSAALFGTYKVKGPDDD
jgi:hypothetical protein